MGFRTRNDYSNPYAASTTPVPIILPGPDGNAGDYDDNKYRLRIGLGGSVVRGHNNMPTLLDQNIAPGTYSAVVTLDAIPEFE